MGLKELRKKQKENGVIGRKDMAENLTKHVNTEIEAFCKEEQFAIHEGLNVFSPHPEDPARPVDATRDLCAYYDLRTKSHGNIPSSPITDFFPIGEGTGAPQAIVGVAHLQKQFDAQLFGGIPVLEHPEDTPPDLKLREASLSRSELGRSFNPETVFMMEVKQDLRIRLRLQHVVAARVPVTGDSGLVPILETVTKAGGQGTAARRLPRYGIQTAQEPLRLTEDGFEIEIDDQARRSSAATMEAVSEAARQRTELFENDIVNGIVQEILTGITGDFSISWSDPPTFKEMMKLHMMLNDNYIFTTFVGTLNGVVEYLAIDPTMNSANNLPATPDRNMFMIIDQMLGRETIAKRSADDVPALGSNDDKKFGCWDRPRAFNFYTERGGSLNDQYREEAERVQIMRFVLTYGGRMRKDADHARAFVTIS